MSEKSDFDELWRKLVPHVRAAVSRHRSRDLALAADDLVQEVRIRVWKVHASDTKARLKPSYYYSVVNSAIIDCLRSYRGTLSHSVRAENPGEQNDDEVALIEQIGSDDAGPDAHFAEQEQRARLLAAIDQLPVERRRAVALFLQGFTVSEIAGLLGCDRTRAHNLTYRGVRALKARMSEDT